MRIRMSAILLALVLLLPSLATAQSTNGTLSGRLTDSQGLAVPGATVTITGPQGSKSTTSDEEGRFSVPFLTPGSYTVRAELSGFRPVEVSAVPVSLGQTSNVTLKMEVGGLTEQVEVTASNTIIDTTSTTTGAVLTAELLSRVPVGRRFSDALYLAPGVSSGGSVGRANPSISGGSGLDNQYVIDGINVTNSGYGALGSYSIIFGSLGNSTPFDFLQEIQVKTGGYEAEFGQATGGVVSAITKSGSNTLRGSLFGFTRPDQLEAPWKQYQSVDGTVQTVASQQHDVGVTVGGPVLHDKIFFFGAFNPVWDVRTLQAPEDFPLRDLGGVDRKRRNINYAAKGTWQLSPGQRIDASFFGDPSKGDMGPQRGSALLGTTRAPDGTPTGFSELSKYGGNSQTVRYDGVLSSMWLLEGSFANARNQIEETPAIDTWMITDRTTPSNQISGGVGFYEQGNDSQNRQFKVKSTNFFGGHELGYGFQYDNVQYSQLNQRTGPTFVAPDGRTTATGAQIDIFPDPTFGRIYRVVRANFNAGRTTKQQYYNFFAQDTWKVGDRLTINPGIRYEQEKLEGSIITDFQLKNNWAPRIGATYDLLGNGRSKLYGSFGIFYARIPNDLAARALSADDSTSRADYFDANLTQPVPNGVLAAGQTQHFLIQGVGADVIDPDAKLSYTREMIVGYEWEAFANTTVGLRYINRRIPRVLEDVAAAPMAAYDLGIAGSVDYILTNPTDETPTVAPDLGAHFEKPIHQYDAVEITLDRRLSNRWSAQASYRWSRLHGTFEGFYREDNGQSDPGITSLYDFPTNDPSYTAIGVPQFDYSGDIRFLGSLGAGPLPLDRPHAVKLYGNYAVTDAFMVGLGLNANSGKPLTAFAANPNYGSGGEIPTTPRGAGIDTVDGFRKRTPFEYQVDVQASYGVHFGARRLTLLADVFNLFNLRRTLDYDAWTEATFGDPNPDFGKPVSRLIAGPQFQSPFALRIGARFEF
jgi:hypothetical protein